MTPCGGPACPGAHTKQRSKSENPEGLVLPLENEAKPEVGRGGLWQAGQPSQQPMLGVVASVAHVSILHLEPPLRP